MSDMERLSRPEEGDSERLREAVRNAVQQAQICGKPLRFGAFIADAPQAVQVVALPIAVWTRIVMLATAGDPSPPELVGPDDEGNRS